MSELEIENRIIEIIQDGNQMDYNNMDELVDVFKINEVSENIMDLIKNKILFDVFHKIHLLHKDTGLGTLNCLKAVQKNPFADLDELKQWLSINSPKF